MNEEIKKIDDTRIEITSKPEPKVEVITYDVKSLLLQRQDILLQKSNLDNDLARVDGLLQKAKDAGVDVDGIEQDLLVNGSVI